MILDQKLKQNILDKFRDKKIAILYGGKSSEREVSLRSGQNVYNAIMSFDEFKNNIILIDVQDTYDLVNQLKKENIKYCYNILHGTYGEDGTIQGLLDSLNIKYTGENILVSSVCMNKVYTKRIWKSENIPTSNFLLVRDIISVCEKYIKTNYTSIDFPLILKHISNGSSVGVYLIKTKEEFENTINTIEDKNNYFIEPFIQGKEITVGIVKSNNDIYTFPIIGINSKNELYDYDAKYTKGKTELQIPAEISKEIEYKVIENMKKAYNILNCRGLCRIDAIISKNDNEVYLMEINTQSGMTDTSDIPAMARHIGMDFKDIVLYVLGLIK